jgi:pimeloyl-ACP methyl ester carboxylesterase
LSDKADGDPVEVAPEAPKSRLTRTARLLLAILAGLLLPGLIGMAFPDLVARLARPMIFYPERLSEREADPAFWGLAAAESVFVDSEEGVRLHGWWIPASRSEVPDESEACEAVIFFHGNAGNIASRAPIAARLADLGLGVLLVDYRGYGRSEGSPSEEGLYADGRAAYRHLVDVKKVSPARLVVIGNSLGAAVATNVASELPVARLVLTGAFRSVPSLARSIYWWMPGRAFGWSINRFDSESRLADVTAPVLVGRGESDRLIPRAETRALYEAASEPKRWFEVAGADHNDLWWTGELWSQLAGFLAGERCAELQEVT